MVLAVLNTEATTLAAKPGNSRSIAARIALLQRARFSS
jgi:hypothetical protein